MLTGSSSRTAAGALRFLDQVPFSSVTASPAADITNRPPAQNESVLLVVKIEDYLRGRHAYFSWSQNRGAR